MKNIYLRVVPTNCGEIMFKFLDMPILIPHFTPADAFLPSKKYELCYIIMTSSKFHQKF